MLYRAEESNGEEKKENTSKNDVIVTLEKKRFTIDHERFQPTAMPEKVAQFSLTIFCVLNLKIEMCLQPSVCLLNYVTYNHGTSLVGIEPNIYCLWGTYTLAFLLIC